ncbi:hypothetical protein PG999_005777 [Apiospora kogelbergensis]|uniref:MARVEL domain-containing protein n=1 Tax=Apiospora kogelbergensis TaxID=1337665 RepID=A0AAW0QVR2_9PEZI
MDVRARKHGYEIIPTPVWVLVVRIFQIVLSVIAIGLAGWWIHGLYLNELGFVIACVSAVLSAPLGSPPTNTPLGKQCVFTWIVSLYNILSEKASGCRPGYNTWATLSLDGLLVVFWLAAMGATASARTSFKYSVTATCTSDGSAINSGHCDILRRYTETVGVATQGALAILSGLAGICALTMLLFVASFAYVCHFFRLSYTEANAMPDPEKQQQQQQQQNGAPGGVVSPAGAPVGTTAGAVPGYPMHTGTEMTPQQPIAQHGAPYASQQQQQQPQQPQQQQQPQQPQHQYQGQQQHQLQHQQQQSPMTPPPSNMGYAQGTGYAQQPQGAVYSQSHTPGPYVQQNMHAPSNTVHSPGQVGQQYPYSPGMSPQGPGQ